MSSEAKKTDKPVLLSRRVAAKRIGISTTTLRRYERADRIRSHVWVNPGSGRRRFRYALEDVVALREALREEIDERSRRREAREVLARTTKEEGQRAAKVYRAIREGRTTRDIVIELEEDPVFVDRLWDAYHRPIEQRSYDKRRVDRQREERAERRAMDRENAIRERVEAQRKAAARPSCPRKAIHEILAAGESCPGRCGFVRPYEGQGETA